MKILCKPKDITSTLVCLIDDYNYFRWSVAWASNGFPLFDKLIEHSDRVAQLVVGIHFYQTSPGFIEAFLHHPAARFVLQTSGTFHPKIYLFENDAADWACVIGSANFTKAAFSGNCEAVVYFNSSEPNAAALYRYIRTTVDDHWALGKQMELDELARYQSLWKLHRKRLNLLSDKYGSSSKGKSLVSVSLFGLNWPEFAAKVKAEELHHSFEDRLAVLKAARSLFEEYTSFSEVPPSEQRDVAGFVPRDGLPWAYFGSMAGAIRFKKAVGANDPALCRAIDSIPMEGAITYDCYNQFVKSFQEAFPHGGDGVAVATRLLAMKRPDTFVCLDKRNRSRLCGAFWN